MGCECRRHRPQTFDCVNMEVLLKIFAAKRRFLLYCLIGVTGAGLDFGVFALLVNIFGVQHYQIANAAGYAIGIVVSFTANARLNFGTRDRLAARFAAFCGVALVGWTAAVLLLALLVGRFQWNVYLAKLATLFAVLLVQYNLNRRLAFRETD